MLTNAFIIQQDTIWSYKNPTKPRFSQIKGVNLYGKFCDNKLYEIDLVKNTEKIYYMYDNDDDLIGIDKGVSSKIHIELEDNQISTVTSMIKPESSSYPETELPENARKLRGFLWRGDERIRSKEDIFPQDEKDLDDAIIKKSTASKKVEDTPMPIKKETLDYDKNNPKPKPPVSTE